MKFEVRDYTGKTVWGYADWDENFGDDIVAFETCFPYKEEVDGFPVNTYTMFRFEDWDERKERLKKYV